MEDKKAASAEAHELPHYALPNFATVLPTYSNHESDVIAQAFRIGNYVSLNDLPDRIKPGQVSRSRFQKILDNRQQDEGHEPMPRAKPKYFSEFEYIPSPYSIADSLAREERQNEAALLEKAGHKQPFSHVVSKFMLKKVIEDWNVTPDDGHLYFTFRPPWISVRVSDAFFSLHPEQRSYADPRLGSTKSLAAATESTSHADADAELAAASSLRPELT